MGYWGGRISKESVIDGTMESQSNLPVQESEKRSHKKPFFISSNTKEEISTPQEVLNTDLKVSTVQTSNVPVPDYDNIRDQMRSFQDKIFAEVNK